MVKRHPRYIPQSVPDFGIFFGSGLFFVTVRAQIARGTTSVTDEFTTFDTSPNGNQVAILATSGAA